MGVAALFRGGDVPVYGVALLLDGLLHGVIEAYSVGGHHGHLAVLHVGDFPCVLDYRGRVACDEIAALAVADKQGSVLSRGDEMLRLIGADNAQRISALDAAQHSEHRLEHIIALGIVIRKKLGHDLGVGLGFELITV